LRKKDGQEVAAREANRAGKKMNRGGGEEVPDLQKKKDTTAKELKVFYLRTSVTWYATMVSGIGHSLRLMSFKKRTASSQWKNPGLGKESWGAIQRVLFMQKIRVLKRGIQTKQKTTQNRVQINNGKNLSYSF